MKLPFKIVPALLSLLLIDPAEAQSPATTPGLNALPEVDFSRLSQRDPNPLGARALAINPQQWKHGETEHFVYHFVDSFVVTPISVEAEFNYRVVTKELQREQPAANTKSHLYVFQKPEDWKQFQSAGKLEPWTGGIQSQGSLFIVRDPSYKFSGNSLGHEIAHLVLHRYYPDGVPLWLNEGFAQYVSKGARASYYRARNYNSKARSQTIESEKLFPLTTLTTMSYPPSDQVATFYDESERLVRFLVATDKASFLSFLDGMGRHQPFETALFQAFGTRFLNVTALEEKFREYAASEFGTSLSSAN
jgi:hypothetical protein